MSSSSQELNESSIEGEVCSFEAISRGKCLGLASVSTPGRAESGVIGVEGLFGFRVAIAAIGRGPRPTGGSLCCLVADEIGRASCRERV